MTPIEKEIARRNKIWKNASKSERQVLVAKDVLKRIKAKKFTAKERNWVTIKSKGSDSQSLQTCFLSETNLCQGCAMGGLMVGLISYKNEVTLADTWINNSNEHYIPGHAVRGAFSLDSVFTENQQRLIELAFENGFGKYRFDWNSHTLRNLWYNDDLVGIRKIVKTSGIDPTDRQNLRIIEFYLSNPNSDVRLRKIMENIVQHNGRFVI